MRSTADWPYRSFWLREKLELGVEIVSAYSRARWWLWRTDLPRTVSALREAARVTGKSLPTSRGQAPVSGGWWDGRFDIFPFDSRCLMRSLVLTSLLARRGIDSSLVIAVLPGPGFEAHAWVEEPGRRAPSGGGATLSPHRGDLMPGTGTSVSVVVPALNAERTIGQVVRALLEQVPSPHEVIVVDDGSTDRTAEIAAGLGSRVVSTGGDGSAGGARNRGWDAATGDVVLFLGLRRHPRTRLRGRARQGAERVPGRDRRVCARTFTARTSWGWVAHLQGETPYLPVGQPRKTAFVSSYCMAVPRRRRCAGTRATAERTRSSA